MGCVWVTLTSLKPLRSSNLPLIQEQFETKEEESEKFAVVLMGDKEYDQGHVVKVLCKVIAGLGAYATCVTACSLFGCGVVCVGMTGRRSVAAASQLTCPLPITL